MTRLPADPHADELRRRAESIADRISAGDADSASILEAADTLHGLCALQTELEASNAKYFTLFELAPVGYVSLDGEGLIVEANPAAARILGHERDSLPGTRLCDLIFDEGETSFAELCEHIDQHTSGPYACEVRLKTATVNPVWLRLDAAPSADSGTDPPPLLVVISDITRRVAAEARLEDNVEHIQEAFALLLTQTRLLAQAETIGHVAAWRVDLNGGGEHAWSDETAHILGFEPDSREDAMAAIREVVLPEDRKAFDEWLCAASEAEEPSRTDFRIVRPDGEIRWVCAHGALEPSGEGEPVSLAGILHDITDRRRADEEHVGYLERAANADGLTGLHNRRGFDIVAGQAIAQAQRANQGIGLIFCDIDNLKTINDEFGHGQGDKALLDAASILRFTLRRADAIARIGGDEFVVLAVGDHVADLTHLKERLHKGLEFFNATNDRPYQLSMSSGTAWCEAGTVCQLEDLMSAADTDMYADKLKKRKHQSPASEGD